MTGDPMSKFVKNRSGAFWAFLGALTFGTLVVAGPIGIESGGYTYVPGLTLTRTDGLANLDCLTPSVTCLFQSQTTAATASGTVGMFTLKPTNAGGADDLILDVQSSAGGHLFTVDQEGDGVVLGKFQTTGAAVAGGTGTVTIGARAGGGFIGIWSNTSVTGATYMIGGSSTGATDINTATGTNCTFGINNSAVGQYGATGFTWNATPFINSSASGNNAFQVSTNGARIDYGAGASDYASSNGTTVTFAGPLATASNLSVTGNVTLTNLAISATAPTISSGFGTSPSVTLNNGTAAFRINVGTGGTANNGVIGLPAAANGWNCFCNDITTQSATVFLCKQTASATNSATIGNFDTTGAAAAWVASDIVNVNCMAL